MEWIKKLEKTYRIRILFLVELDSHTYGYSHAQSDHDYVGCFTYPLRAYHTLNPPKEEYQGGIGNVHYKLYDIHKFMKLLLKSNITILEALSAPRPYVVLNKLSHYGKLRDEALLHFSRRTAINQYLSICKKNLHALEKRKTIDVTKILLISIRACLCALFIAKYGEFPPLSIYEVLDFLPLLEFKSVVPLLLKARREFSSLNFEYHKFIHNILQLCRKVKICDRCEIDRDLLNFVLWENIIKHSFQ